MVEFPVTNGLGLTIAGGIDMPMSDEDACIYITGIQPGGSAQRDGRLKIGDRVSIGLASAILMLRDVVSPSGC